MVEETILPPEIFAEILSRLEVKSLLVLKCVCKLWCSIIESRNFIQMHSRRAKTKYVPKEGLYEDTRDRKDLELLYIRNGLMLEKHRTTNKFSIRNPATKTKVDLPERRRKPTLTGFLHLPTSDSYKVVVVFGKKGRRTIGGCRVLTLGIDLAWRILDTPNLNCLKDSQLDARLFLCTDVVVYVMWFSDVSRTRTARDIVCIEMETEGLETVTAPEALFSSWEGVRPKKWEGKLSLYKTVGQELHVWVLEDYKNQKWADRKITISLSFLSKHASISTNLYPGNLTKGWLYIFDNHGIYRIAYNVKSRRELILGENTSYNVKFNLMNPFRSSPTDY